jgi:hypothetical protein
MCHALWSGRVERIALVGSSPSDERVGYLAPKNFLPELRKELGDIASEVHGRLVLAKGPARPVAWAANVWCDPMRMPISSIGDAAKKLRAIQRNWALYSFSSHRRAALISEKLPKVAAKPIVFGAAAPRAPLGSWTLIDAETILAAPHCSSPFPNGEVQFVEDRAAPPSRAYLKLWELFTLLGQRPEPKAAVRSQRCSERSVRSPWCWATKKEDSGLRPCRPATRPSQFPGWERCNRSTWPPARRSLSTPWPPDGIAPGLTQPDEARVAPLGVRSVRRFRHPGDLYAALMRTGRLPSRIHMRR